MNSFMNCAFKAMEIRKKNFAPTGKRILLQYNKQIVKEKEDDEEDE